MTWATIYTDGQVFATEQFMEVYRRNSGFLDEEYFQNSVRNGGIELLLARFTAVRENENSQFQDYDISSERGTATLTLHHALEPTMRFALHLQDAYSFNDPTFPIEIQAFYRERRLVGFRDWDTTLEPPEPLPH